MWDWPKPDRTGITAQRASLARCTQRRQGFSSQAPACPQPSGMHGSQRSVLAARSASALLDSEQQTREMMYLILSYHPC